MSNKRSYNTEEALQIFLEPDLNSKIKKIEESNDEEPDLSPVAPQPKIGQDLQSETDFAVTENRQNGDGDVEEMGPEDSINNDAPKCDNDDIDISKCTNHIPRQCVSIPPACNSNFLGDGFGLPTNNADTWTLLSYFELFRKDELSQLLYQQTNLYTVPNQNL